MKKIISYLFLFFLIIKPLYNVSCITYYELNIDYIIETYCVNKETPKLQCNGKCHLANQLSNLQVNNLGDEYVNLIIEIFVPVYFKTYAYHFKLIAIPAVLQNNWKYTVAMASQHQDVLDRPPQFN